MRYRVWTADMAEVIKITTSLVRDKRPFRVEAEGDDSPRGFPNWTVSWEEGAAFGYWHKEDLACGVTTASVEIAAERTRQVTEEGYSGDHDDRHNAGMLAAAAAYYAAPKNLDGTLFTEGDEESVHEAVAGWLWPWGPKCPPKKYPRRRELVIAGALVIAEIERIDRASIRKEAKDRGLESKPE